MRPMSGQKIFMTTEKSTDRYSLASIALHWLMLLVLAAVYAAIELREFYPKGSDPREALKMWHFTLGLSVFGLVWLRIVARLVWPAPSPVEGQAWLKPIAKFTHLALYLLMIAMPLAGWVILSAEGEPVPFFGLELPALTGANEALAERVEELHEVMGTIGYWLIGLHALASLFHHYVLRDRLLARMLPRSIQTSARS
jgi:cytochrome b561